MEGMAKPTKREIVKSIRLAWDSLESHLSFSEKPLAKKLRKHISTVGGQRFHQKCVREYAEIIHTLAKSL